MGSKITEAIMFGFCFSSLFLLIFKSNYPKLIKLKTFEKGNKVNTLKILYLSSKVD